MRGRLIFPVLAGLRALDTTATAQASGYDQTFREARRTDDGTWRGTSQKVYAAEIRLKCQVEDFYYENLDAFMSGNEFQHKLGLVFHFRDLTGAGLVTTATGNAEVQVGTLLVALYDLDGNVLQTMPDPGLYAVESAPMGYGMGRKLNLLTVLFQSRDQGVR